GRAGVVELHHQAVFEFRVRFLRAVQRDRPDGAGAAGRLDPDVAGVQPPRGVFEEVKEQPSATLAHLHPVQAVAATLAELAAPRVARDLQIAPPQLAAHNPSGTDRGRLVAEPVASTV